MTIAITIPSPPTLSQDYDDDHYDDDDDYYYYYYDYNLLQITIAIARPSPVPPHTTTL